MTNSTNFDQTLFTSMWHEWGEGPRLDFKSDIYYCSTEDEKFEFIKDLIAFGNVARRIGKPCWILFGVEQGSSNLIDIEDDYYGGKRKANFSKEATIHDLQVDKNLESYRKLADAWISPQAPEIDLHYGKIDGVFVSYLEIKPTYSSRPFSLMKPFRSAKKQNRFFDRGTVFIRKNSSSVVLIQSEVKYLLQKCDVEYLGRSEWDRIINAHRIGEFQRAHEILPYIEVYSEQFPKVPMLKSVMYFLNNGEKRIIIDGRAGDGKSVFLRCLAYEYAMRASEWNSDRKEFGFDENDQENIKLNDNEKNQETENSSFQEVKITDLEVKPPIPIVLFLTLRTVFHSTDNVDKQICNRISEILQLKQRDPFSYSERYFNIPNTKWVLILDGLDELRIPKESGPVLRTRIENLPKNVQVVISTRKNQDNFNGFKEFTIRSLSRENISDYIYSRINKAFEVGNTELQVVDDVSKYHADIMEWIEQHGDFLSLINNFRSLHGFMDYLFPENIPPIAEDDQDIVKLENIKKIQVETSSLNDSIPYFDESDLISEPYLVQEISTKESIENNSDESKFKMPNEALAIKYVLNYVQEEEKKRKDEFGINAKHLAEQSRRYLSMIAWESKWDNIFVYVKPNENDEKLDWNTNLGYIQTADYFSYKFMCLLLKRYMTAEYAYFWSESDPEGIIYTLKKNQNQYTVVTPKIIDLINQLRIANGRDALIQN